ELTVEQETESTTQILRVPSHMDVDVNSQHADNSTNHQICCLENSTVIPPWHFNTRLRRLHTKFQNVILYQHICVPCVYCARLLYPQKAKWVPYDENITYPLQTHFPEIDIIFSGSSTQPKV